MKIIHTPAYKKAFIQYLRRGVPIDVTLKTLAKTEHSTTHYIWRTQGDGKVRAEHAANEGRIFSWDNPPATGHPGEGYGCRCWAEPVELKTFADLLLQYLRQNPYWGNDEMSLYFYVGGGKPVTLSQIGHLELIKNYYEEQYFPLFLKQIERSTLFARQGDFTDSFEQSYNFYDVLYSYRKSGVYGTFIGEISDISAYSRIVKGSVYIRFEDAFKDPMEIAQTWVSLANSIPFIGDTAERNLWSWFRSLTDLGGDPYVITGQWEIPVEIIVEDFGTLIPEE